MTRSNPPHGQRSCAVRPLAAVAASLCLGLPGTRVAAAADPAPSPEISVRETRGIYQVTARFQVPQSSDVMLAVLSDYEQIPTVTYELTAEPGFDVPEFILERLLRRDSGEMIKQLRIESSARARGRTESMSPSQPPR